MPSVPLHVVGGLVEVSDPRDVVLPGDAEHDAGVGDDDGRVPQDVAVGGVALEDRADDHHVVLGGVLGRNEKVQPMRIFYSAFFFQMKRN